jgi:hypothetical protein
MKRTTRRELLTAVTAAAAAPQLHAQHQHETSLIQITSGPYRPKVFTAAQMKWLAALADTIIPRTDTPGASDAGVPAFIDRRTASNPELTTQIRKGMELLDAAAVQQFHSKFPALSSTDAVALLTPLEGARDTDLGAFFSLMKGLTIDGYYTSQEGLVKELRWHGNTYLTEFKGCTHPEHQA